jgi:hypothetical protein
VDVRTADVAPAAARERVARVVVDGERAAPQVIAVLVGVVLAAVRVEFVLV